MSAFNNHSDTIAAIATAPGRGGIGIVRVSGADLRPFYEAICGRALDARKAQVCAFYDQSGEVIDQGIALYFPAPGSFTGEDCLELHGHGGPVILDALLQRCFQVGARSAQPGEFSERAFLNGKLDLAQAEAIADLIDASSRQAARSAMRSLEGEFSREINQLVEELTELRVFVEASIDFPEEEIDFLADNRIAAALTTLQSRLQDILRRAQQGVLLRDGMTVVLAGRPNAGKSSVLNALAGRDSAIVTEIPGTTRDVLREQINLDGLPLHIVDTAGLRDSEDVVEQEGVRRAWREIARADLVMFVVDASVEGTQIELTKIWPEYFQHSENNEIPFVVLLNKTDLLAGPLELGVSEYSTLAISAKYHRGLDALTDHLKAVAGMVDLKEGAFAARRRHIRLLEGALKLIASGARQLQLTDAGELLAEDLRQAQNLLGEITGKITTEELLGRIFSTFCIGK